MNREVDDYALVPTLILAQEFCQETIDPSCRYLFCADPLWALAYLAWQGSSRAIIGQSQSRQSRGRDLGAPNHARIQIHAD